MKSLNQPNRDLFFNSLGLGARARTQYIRASPDSESKHLAAMLRF